MYPGRHLPPASGPDSPVDEPNLFDLLKDRRSIRKYRKTKPDPRQIDRIIDAASYAPSAHNAQPWRFYVVSDEKKRDDLIEQMAARFRQDMVKDRVTEKVISQKTRQSARLFGNAPLLIVAGIDMTAMDKYSDAARQQAETLMATQSLAAAIQNLLLAAKAIGLGGCWYCAPLFCSAVVKSVLSLPEAFVPQALITLGYPAERPPAPPRLKLDEIRFTI